MMVDKNNDDFALGGWRGYLEPSLKPRQEPGDLKISIGKPVYWPAEQQLVDWHSPKGYKSYLIKVAFTLWLPSKVRAREVFFYMDLHPQERQQPVILLAAPQQLTGEKKEPFSLQLKPTFKAFGGELSIGTANFNLDSGNVYPVVRVYGLHEGKVCWRYNDHPDYPLEGYREMYAVVCIPDGLENILVSIHLETVLKGRFGKAPWRLPQSLHWVLTP